MKRDHRTSAQQGALAAILAAGAAGCGSREEVNLASVKPVSSSAPKIQLDNAGVDAFVQLIVDQSNFLRDLPLDLRIQDVADAEYGNAVIKGRALQQYLEARADIRSKFKGFSEGTRERILFKIKQRGQDAIDPAVQRCLKDFHQAFEWKVIIMG